MSTERPTSSADIPSWARSFQAKMFDDGWLVPAYPPEFGGRNASLFEQMVYLDELGRRQVARTYNPQGVGIVSASIVSFGTDEQKKRWAVPVLRAERTAALGMSEPGAGSDLAALSTRAVLDGDNPALSGPANLERKAAVVAERDAQRQVVSLLSQRMRDVAVARYCWSVRYRLVNGSPTRPEINQWLEEAENYVQRSRRRMDLVEIRLDEARGELATLIKDTPGMDDVARRWLQRRFIARAG